MRFPIARLSQFFHRRSKSDSALSRHLDPPAESTRRAHSASYIHGLTHAEDTRSSLSSDILAGVPVTPVNIRIRPLSSGTISSAVTANSTGTHISTASYTVVVEVLTRRIQELEESVRMHEVNAGLISSLEQELQSSRLALQEARISNSLPISTVAGLESDVAGVQTDISATPPQARRYVDEKLPAEEHGEVKSPDMVLSLLTPGADRSVLDSAYKRVLAGEDPEDALVDAIKEAVSKPGSTWRRLLEPVVGERSPEDYIAQVNCTLQARRESRVLRNKTAFWKINAKQGGRHSDTVTPSASHISDVVKELAEDPKTVAEGPSMEKKQDTAVQTDRRNVDPDATPRPGIYTSASILAQVPLQPIKEAQPETPRTKGQRIDPDSTRSLVSSKAQRDVKSPTTMTKMSPYPNLRPLASVTFRESHSIRSISSKREFWGLSTSDSTSSQDTRHLQKAHKPMPAFGIPPSDQDCSAPASTKESTSRTRSNDSLSEPTSAPPSASESSTDQPVSSSSSGSADASGSTPAAVARSESAFSSSSWDHLSSFMARSFSPFGGDLQGTLTILTPGNSKRESRMSPPRVSTASTDSSPSTSPTKKSRLPVPVTTPKVKRIAPKAAFMKRLSFVISRPVLMDSTNAAATITPPRASTAKTSKASAEVPSSLSPLKFADPPRKSRARADPAAKTGKKDDENAAPTGRRIPWDLGKGKGPSRPKLLRRGAAS